jgi:predicted secreted Zn-dependent protease
MLAKRTLGQRFSQSRPNELNEGVGERIFMMRRTIATFVLVLFAAAPSAAENRIEVASIEKGLSSRTNKVLPPAVTEKYEYYEVCGCNEEELYCDLRKKCGKWTDGKKYDSLTSWEIQWDHEYGRNSRTCEVNSFMPIVNITFRYPKWKRTEEASQSLMEKWDRYLENLIAHENGHRDMVVETMNDLSHAVAQLPPAPSCDDLDRNVRALFRKYLAKMNKDQLEYDKTTKHGATQGAVFP